MALPKGVKASRYVRKCLFPATGFELTGRTGSAQRLDEPVRVVGHVDHALRLYAEKSLGNDLRGIAAHCYHPIIFDRREQTAISLEVPPICRFFLFLSSSEKRRLGKEWGIT